MTAPLELDNLLVLLLYNPLPSMVEIFVYIFLSYIFVHSFVPCVITVNTRVGNHGSDLF